MNTKNIESPSRELLKKAKATLGFTLDGLALATRTKPHNLKNYYYGQADVPGDLTLQIQAMLKAHKRKTSKQG